MAARCSFDVIRSDYDIEGVKAGAHCVGPVPVIEGIGREDARRERWVWGGGVRLVARGGGGARCGYMMCCLASWQERVARAEAETESKDTKTVEPTGK
ncbi:g8929 [Coccomyxa viridis]|uniref:G8929 protein n=1 Tax=Coccomyxa viridis TaxID=1274662 RepID=A0ABP1G480_9CHLO